MEVLPQQILKASKLEKDELYVKLAEKYGWTFDYIATMNFFQQIKAAKGTKYKVFNSQDEYFNYMASRRAG